MQRLKDVEMSRISAYELIELLSENYPRKNWQPGTPHAEIMFESGKTDLVETLIHQRRKEENG